MAMTYPNYFLYRDNSHEWRWRYTSRNGRIIAVSSESYRNYSDCLASVQIMQASNSSPIYYEQDQRRAFGS
jgi:uncharacterized protein YegP (UPF0339 family)